MRASKTKCIISTLIPSFPDVHPTWMTSTIIYLTVPVICSITTTTVSFLLSSALLAITSFLLIDVSSRIPSHLYVPIILDLVFITGLVIKSCRQRWHLAGFFRCRVHRSWTRRWPDESLFVSVCRIARSSSFILQAKFGLGRIERLTERLCFEQLFYRILYSCFVF